MLRLKVLGGLGVAREGMDLRGAATQRRRLALLAILAVAGKKGMSRDRLLTLLWPDTSEAKGRHGLAQSIYALKRDLAADDLFVGTSELRLNRNAITSDVDEFRDAIAAGELKQAAEHYHGPLLDGVYLSGAPDFERWLDAERARLAASYASSLESLADEQEMRGDIVSASATLGRLASLDPLNKRTVVRAMKCFVAAGDVAAAIALAQQHEVERKEELEMAADQEVLALRAEIARADKENHTVSNGDSDSSVIASSDDGLLPAVEPRGADAAGEPGSTDAASEGVHSAPHAPQRKSGARYWIAAAALLIVVAVSVIARNVVSADAENSVATRIAVLPFAVRGNSRLSYLTDGMVDLLGQRLDGFGVLHTVDPNAMLEFIRADSSRSATPATGVEAARHFGAGQYLLGSVVDAGGRVQISATIYDANGKRLAVADASAASESDIMRVVDDVARGLIRAELGNDARFGKEAALSTSSLPALKNFLEGEEALRSSRYAAAVEFYQKAVELDSTFALAWYRISTTADWQSQSALVSQAIHKAKSFEARLPSEDRLLLDARTASLAGNDDEVERVYNTILSAHPEDAEAWTQLAETIFHNGRWRGRPIDESRNAFAHVAALRPADGSSRLHLARLAALRDDSAALDTLLPQAALGVTDAGEKLELSTLVALASDDMHRRARFLDSLASLRDVGVQAEAVQLAAWRIATFATDASTAERMALILASSETTPQTRASGLVLAAHMAGARGRWNESKKFLDAASNLDPSLAARTRANLASSGIFPLGPGENENIAAQVSRLTLSSSGRSSITDAWVVGRLAAMRHDTVAALKSVARMDTFAASDTSLAPIVLHLRNQIEARVAAVRGDTISALALVEAGWPRTNPLAHYQWLQSDAYTMASSRFSRARLLESTGRLEEALQWYETVPEDQGYSTILLAPSYLRRAVIEEKLGRKRAAAELYGRFVKLWRDADPELQPQVRFARSRQQLLVEH
jgi:DNA-binding SARP family transcriptional activator/TolB-like protein